ncbi:chaperonin 10-like protein [Talaromyces proteolyticus]|uniref:Chaperonin 10-like protein n=1 Tax=Talaromyces proteolyticus TaxID=1131652 RepID=A0AAD4KLT2_9EURO|nr:chaperonin 10-like protein [Talaromyces proteolyticus]KAH8695598.1 chaperonin 10-like protein [Talaromyces proteolyticus]
MSSSPASHHQALVIAEKGASHSLVSRVTSQPGPGQLLVEVKAIALNPVDAVQRDSGFLISKYPTVLGSDVAGIVISVGPDVPLDTPQPGTRVAAYATAYFHQGEADFGAFQQFVIVGVEKVAPLPDSISFCEGSILPMSVSVALSGWNVLGIPRDTAYSSEDREGILIWGASTSVGTAAVQSAKSMGYHVYATSSPRHHQYLKTLGADRVFNYNSDDVVSEIVNSVKEDDVTLHQCFLGRGSLEPIASILKQLKGTRNAKVASAPLIPEEAKKLDGVDIIFILTPRDPKASYDYFRWAFVEWLKEKLAADDYIPSPHLKVVGRGLESIDNALDGLKQGVSGTKLVVEL